MSTAIGTAVVNERIHSLYARLRAGAAASTALGARVRTGWQASHGGSTAACSLPACSCLPRSGSAPPFFASSGMDLSEHPYQHWRPQSAVPRRAAGGGVRLGGAAGVRAVRGGVPDRARLRGRGDASTCRRPCM